MKYCPTCETRFDDEVMRFCTKDGAPLVEEEKPNFTTLPSEELSGPVAAAVEDDDDASEVTVVRSNISIPPPPSMDDNDFSEPEPQRQAELIVVPPAQQPTFAPIRNRGSAVYYPPPRQNTFKIVVLTVVGT